MRISGFLFNSNYIRLYSYGDVSTSTISCAPQKRTSCVIGYLPSSIGTYRYTIKGSNVESSHTPCATQPITEKQKPLTQSDIIQINFLFLYFDCKLTNSTLQQYQIRCEIQDKALVLVHLVRQLGHILCFTSSVDTANRLALLTGTLSEY